jgi:acyl dehydratase
MALNRECLGKDYEPGEYAVTAEATKAYAASYNQTNPRYFDDARPGGVIACPMFAMVYTWDAALRPAFDPEVRVNFLRLVRAGVEIENHAVVRPGDVVTTHAKIVAMEEKSSGEILSIRTESFNQRGEKVATILNHHFIRGEKKGEKKSEGPPAPPERGPEVLRATMRVKLNQSLVYAKASKDENPIHTDENVAKMAGFPGVILQGSCTMAFACGHIVDELLGGESTRLRRISVRFAKPVFPNDLLTTVGWRERGEGDAKVVAFETTNQEGVVVLASGLAHL